MKKDPAPAHKILLVDNNSKGLEARRIILADHGYEVATALSGEQALEILDQQTFDVVVTDLRMDGIDGIELIRRIRAVNAMTPVILLSGYIACSGLTLEESGADELISKSNKEIPELLRAIRRLAARPRRRSVASQRNVSAKSRTANAN